jgi:hypothetical protein
MMFHVSRKQKCVQRLLHGGPSFVTYATDLNFHFPGSRGPHHEPRTELVPTRASANRFSTLNNLSNVSSRLRKLHTHSPSLSRFDRNSGSVEESRHRNEFPSERISSQTESAISAYSEEENDDDEAEQMKQDIWSLGPVPTPTFTFAAYANDSEIIQKLVKLGVDLSELEKRREVMPYILKLNYEKKVIPCVE